MHVMHCGKCTIPVVSLAQQSELRHCSGSIAASCSNRARAMSVTRSQMTEAPAWLSVLPRHAASPTGPQAYKFLDRPRFCSSFLLMTLPFK